jgi:hypothetical protein
MNRRYTAVAARALHRCEYCRAPEVVFNLAFEVEHIVPPGAGGGEDGANLALACRSCNVFKSDSIDAVDPLTHTSVRLFSPRLDRWDQHFRSLPTGEIEGLTEIGRATAALLRMNTSVQINARLSWMRLEMYP